MTLRHLKIFIAVAEEKTMHSAAKKLYISQPSISQAISELEKTYNVKLFERISQRLYITDTGTELLNYAYRITNMYDEMEQMLHMKGNLQKLKIGASVSVGTSLLYKILDVLKEKYPDLQLSVVVDNTSCIEQLIMESKIDAGVVEGVITQKDIICRHICEDELIVAASPSHHLAQKGVCSIEDIKNEVFISREKGSNDRNQFERFLQENNIEIDKTWVFSNTEAIKNAVKSGYGLSVLSRMVVQEELDSKEIAQIQIDGINIKRSIRLIMHKDKFISKEIKWFADACGLNGDTAD